MGPFSRPMVGEGQRTPFGKSASMTVALVTQLCLSLCDPMDCSPPDSSVHGILQARTLEWVAIPFSRESSPPRDWTLVSLQADSLSLPLRKPLDAFPLMLCAEMTELETSLSGVLRKIGVWELPPKEMKELVTLFHSFQEGKLQFGLKRSPQTMRTARETLLCLSLGQASQATSGEGSIFFIVNSLQTNMWSWMATSHHPHRPVYTLVNEARRWVENLMRFNVQQLYTCLSILP